ncbi:MAG: hypothetical protein WCT46_06195 [Candidatus Gracilibacteria bacterium]
MNEAGLNLRRTAFVTLVALAAPFAATGCNNGKIQQTPEECAESGSGYNGYVMEVSGVQGGQNPDTGGERYVIAASVGNEYPANEGGQVGITCIASEDGDMIDFVPLIDGTITYDTEGSLEQGTIQDLTFDCFEVKDDMCASNLFITDGEEGGEAHWLYIQ